METINERMTLNKVFTEIRFSPNPLFSDLKLLTSYMNFLKLVFDFVTYEEHSKQIICNSVDGKNHATVSGTRLVVDFNIPTKYDEFISTSDSIITEYTSKFEVPQFDRTGIRYNLPAKFNNLEEATKLLFDKFFHVLRETKTPEDLLAGCNSGKVDLYYALDDKKLNISILPARIQMLEMKIGSFGHENAVQTTIDGLLFDMDYYCEGKITLSQYKSQLSSGISIVRAKAINILKALGV